MSGPIRMSLIRLVGGPGVGKSHVCRQLAGAMGMTIESIAIAGSGQELHFTGLSKSRHCAGGIALCRDPRRLAYCQSIDHGG